jgi:CheY-like chemotaxis protein
MPILDGFEATRRIRIHEESAAKQPLFIVALTGTQITERAAASSNFIPGIDGCHLS